MAHQRLQMFRPRIMTSQSTEVPTTRATQELNVSGRVAVRHLKNYLRVLMQQQSLILSKKSTFIILYRVIFSSYSLH